jgi:hypothetical protein
MGTFLLLEGMAAQHARSRHRRGFTGALDDIHQRLPRAAAKAVHTLLAGNGELVHLRITYRIDLHEGNADRVVGEYSTAGIRGRGEGRGKHKGKHEDLSDDEWRRAPRMTGHEMTWRDPHLLAQLDARHLIDLHQLINTPQSRLLLTCYKVGANTK